MVRSTTKLLEAIAKAKRDGWYRHVRQGPGQEADERAMLAGCYVDQHRIDHWLEFADSYGTLTEGPWKGQPFRLIDWQATATSRVFGWVRYSDQWRAVVRRFRFWYEEVPKKNGKTPLLSLVGNYLLFGDSWARQINLFLAATTRKQAERCLMHAIRQIRVQPDLSEEATIRKLEGFHSVTFGDNEWNVVAADPESADGVNGHCLGDEIHRWVGHEFFNTLKYMIASQPEGLFAAITTAGKSRDCVARTLHDKTIAVNAGRQIDQEFYGEIYGAAVDDDPHDEATWLKANPSVGTTPEAPLKLEAFRSDYEDAKAEPSRWPAWLRLRLGRWLSAEDGWIDTACPRGIDDWDSGKTERVNARKRAKRAKRRAPRIDCYEPFKESKLAEVAQNCPAYLGLDFAAVRDTNAAVASVVRPDGTIAIVPRFWLPEKEAERQNKRTPYGEWARRGYVKLIPGEIVDYTVIFEDCVELIQSFGITKFFYDPLFKAEWFTQRLEEETGAQRWEFAQTITEYGPVVKELERLIISHLIRHNGNHLLTWQIGNAIARSNTNGDKRLVKPGSSDYRKVDGAHALLMSLHDAITGLEDRDYYDDHDVEEV